MWEVSEYEFDLPKNRPNGKSEHRASIRGGLGNTNPHTTSAYILSEATPAELWATHSDQPGASYVRDVFTVRTSIIGVGALTPLKEGVLHPGHVQPQPRKAVKPAGQIVLFKKILEDWGFSDREAAILLGFEAASEVREVLSGAKAVRQRDVNDRLRAVLRIATDLDSLFRDVDAIRDWLSERQSMLGDATPRALLLEGSMENLLRVKHYVAFLWVVSRARRA
jgi:hypothetical protein